MTTSEVVVGEGRSSGTPRPLDSALLLLLGAEEALPDSGLAAAAERAGIYTVVARRADAAAYQAFDSQPDLAPHRVNVWHEGASPFGESDVDLVLRANGIRNVVIAGGLGADPALAVQDLRRRAYAAEAPDTTRADLIARAWLEDPEEARNWQPEVKMQRLARPLVDRVAPARTALILIDVLNDFCAPGGKIAATGAATPAVQAALPRISGLLTAARAAGVGVIHVQATYGPHYRAEGSPYRFPSAETAEGAVWSASSFDAAPDSPAFDRNMTEVCLEGSWGIDFVDGLQPVPGEHVVRKHRYSAAIDTRLGHLLRSLGVETVILAGVTTNCCVESTARDLAMSDYNVVVAEDCVAVKDLVMHLHHASLEQIRTYFGIVTDSGRIAACWP